MFALYYIAAYLVGVTGYFQKDYVNQYTTVSYKYERKVIGENPFSNVEVYQNIIDASTTEIMDDYKIPNNRTCFKLADKYTSFQPVEGRCKKWNCWGSQVTLVTKYQIEMVYNRFRRMAATQNCKKYCQLHEISNMVELVWHWTLEEQARDISSRCPHKVFSINEERIDVKGLGCEILDSLDTKQLPTDFANIKARKVQFCVANDLLCESAATSTELNTISQMYLITKLTELLEDNEMNDFTNGTFRRGNANYFGCTMILRNRISERTGDFKNVQNSPVGHFLCVFCTKEKTMSSSFGKAATNCPTYTKPHNALCESGMKDIFACQVDKIDRLCKRTEEIVDDWIYELVGVVKEVALLPIHGRTSLTPFINETVISQHISKEGTLVYTYISTQYYDPDQLPFPIDPDIPPNIVDYDTDEIANFNNSVLNETAGADWINYDYRPYDVPDRLFRGAACCLWFFIVSVILLALTIAMIIAIYVRQSKYSKNK